MFDEKLPSTTDRDLAIRLCDDIKSKENSFASTRKYTVIHYADRNVSRISSKGSGKKAKGLQRFFYKHASRMNEEDRKLFKLRAEKVFGCGRDMFSLQTKPINTPSQTLRSWSGDNLNLHEGTYEMLPSFNCKNWSGEKEKVVFGIVSNDIERLENLIKDISKAAGSPLTCFNAFVVVFSNTIDPAFTEQVYSTFDKYNVCGYVLESSNDIAHFILKGGSYGSIDLPFPICLSRTILQVFAFLISREIEVEAIVILDDDKRLPSGWTPLDSLNDSNPDISIGRDIRTPPNPSLMSIRLNLLDLLYAMDRYHLSGSDSHEVREFSNNLNVYDSTNKRNKSDKFDWYYDMSSSRTDHIEMPFYRSNDLFPENFDSNMDEQMKEWLNAMLVGTPLFRDVIPLESGPTTQRGGCMVIRRKNKDDDSFNVLAVGQDAPKIMLTSNKSIYSRRSDSIWCKHHINQGKQVEVNTYPVYHQNIFDKVPSPSNMRRVMIQEACGGIICRPRKERKSYAESRVIALRSWILRVQGLLQAFRSRVYCSKKMIDYFIKPLEDIFDSQKWEDEVIDVIKRHSIDLEYYVPMPTNYSKIIENIPLEAINSIKQKWDKSTRIIKAKSIIEKEVGEDAIFVGIGQEGVVFRMCMDVYKLFDQVEKADLPTDVEVREYNAQYVKTSTSSTILKRVFIRGDEYRGGHGPALICLLRNMKQKNLYHSNIAPNNIIIEEKTGKLHLVDVGRDSFVGKRGYNKKFTDMCKRAYLCFRFGSYADNDNKMVLLKKWMKEDVSTKPYVGFKDFLIAIETNNDTKLSSLVISFDEQESSVKFLEVSKTKLPINIIEAGIPKTMATDLYVSKGEIEGGLDLQIIALVKSSCIEHAENVCVRVHSECLTGDIFHSLKCDCGSQKEKFMIVMNQVPDSVFLYIKGHEGRGAGLYKKIMAYGLLDRKYDTNYTHIDALHEVGCKSDIRKYDAAFSFLQKTLKVKSVKLFTNNPAKLNTACKYFPCCLQENMPTCPTVSNFQYLKEKEELCDHKGLIETSN